MSALTNFAEDAICDWLADGTGTSPHAGYTIHAYTANPTETGAAGTEVSAGGYSSQSIDLSSQGDGTMENDAEIVFGPASASWGTVSHFLIKDASANPWYYGALTASKAIDDGDSLTIAAGALVITFD